jgi:DNA invertase Pin-like site-specific DNA recombinase
MGAAGPHGRLMLTVLGGLAEFERELIRARTGEAVSALKPVGLSLVGLRSSMPINAVRPLSGFVMARRRPRLRGLMV